MALTKIRNAAPWLRLFTATILTVLLLAGDMAASSGAAEASGMFIGGFLVVYFGGGWLYDKLRGSRREGEGDAVTE